MSTDMARTRQQVARPALAHYHFSTTITPPPANVEKNSAPGYHCPQTLTWAIPQNPPQSSKGKQRYEEKTMLR